MASGQPENALTYADVVAKAAVTHARLSFKYASASPAPEAADPAAGARKRTFAEALQNARQRGVAATRRRMALHVKSEALSPPHAAVPSVAAVLLRPAPALVTAAPSDAAPSELDAAALQLAGASAAAAADGNTDDADEDDAGDSEGEEGEDPANDAENVVPAQAPLGNAHLGAGAPAKAAAPGMRALTVSGGRSNRGSGLTATLQLAPSEGLKELKKRLRRSFGKVRSRAARSRGRAPSPAHSPRPSSPLSGPPALGIAQLDCHRFGSLAVVDAAGRVLRARATKADLVDGARLQISYRYSVGNPAFLNGRRRSASPPSASFERDEREDIFAPLEAGARSAAHWLGWF